MGPGRWESRVFGHSTNTSPRVASGVYDVFERHVTGVRTIFSRPSASLYFTYHFGAALVPRLITEPIASRRLVSSEATLAPL